MRTQHLTTPTTLIATCLTALLALAAVPACNINRVVRVDQVALIPAPTGPRILGPMAQRGVWSVQGDFTGAWVPSPTRSRTERASHEAPTTQLRGAASVALASRLELSLWGDLGHRALASDTALGINKGELTESTSAWAGVTMRNRFPIGRHAIRLSSEFGVGRVPWARMVRVTDWVRDSKTEADPAGRSEPLVRAQLPGTGRPGEQWQRFQDAFIRRDAAVAARTAVFAQAELTLRPDVHLNLGAGLQFVPYAPGLQRVFLECGDSDSPDVRDQVCGIDDQAEILRTAMLGTFTVGVDWPMGDVAWFADGWYHFSDGETGAASAPFGLALGLRY